MEITQETSRLKKPDWLRVKLPTGAEYVKVRGIVGKHKLNTICESGNCPNMGECWGEGTATFMILGNICTRSCGFCAVATGKPKPADWDEPKRIAESVKLMGVKHCVITSVDRDDLKDGGSIIWAETIKEIRKASPNTKFECLIPDFAGKWENLQRIIDANADIVSHNIETVRRLTAQVRIQAKYDRSLEVLKRLSEAGVKTKSGLMLGLGETEEEIFETIDDLSNVKCNVLTMGQYLQPTPKHIPVAKFVHPDDFLRYKNYALTKGFRFVESGPLVRSSYHAEKHIF
ncbi:MAG: lipoyl synthase [Bacteroidota bacterium]